MTSNDKLLRKILHLTRGGWQGGRPPPKLFGWFYLGPLPMAQPHKKPSNQCKESMISMIVFVPPSCLLVPCIKRLLAVNFFVIHEVSSFVG